MQTSFTSPKDFLDSCDFFLPDAEEITWDSDKFKLPGSSSMSTSSSSDSLDSVSSSNSVLGAVSVALSAVSPVPSNFQKKPSPLSVNTSPLTLDTFSLFRNQNVPFSATSPTIFSPVDRIESGGTLSPINSLSAQPLSAGIFDAMMTLTPSSAGGKAYVCSCGKSFEKKYCLNSHRKSHSTEKPFQCSCQKSFGRNHDLLRHIRTVHRSTDYDLYVVGSVKDEK